MTFQIALLYFFFFLTALSAGSLLFTKNVFKGALLLLTCLLSIAAIYVFAFAEFVAITQIMIYAGGILVVIIFGIMLTTKLSGKPLAVKNTHIFPGMLVGIAVMTLLSSSFREVFNTTKSITQVPPENAVTATGIQLMSTYVLPFEIAGILMLIALLGAAVITTSYSRKI
jgi:NADH:ubiquinone oxidoreductase subunit 6 (subunit J)